MRGVLRTGERIVGKGRLGGLCSTLLDEITVPRIPKPHVREGGGEGEEQDQHRTPILASHIECKVIVPPQ